MPELPRPQRKPGERRTAGPCERAAQDAGKRRQEVDTAQGDRGTDQRRACLRREAGDGRSRAAPEGLNGFPGVGLRAMEALANSGEILWVSPASVSRETCGFGRPRLWPELTVCASASRCGGFDDPVSVWRDHLAEPRVAAAKAVRNLTGMSPHTDRNASALLEETARRTGPSQ